MPRIYIAGKLNDESAGYIRNLAKMVAYTEKIRKLGASVFCPGFDILGGLVSGDLDYKDYFDNNREWIKVSDAVALVDNWQTSKGTLREIKIATDNRVPVLYNFDMVKEFIRDFKEE